MTFNNDPLNLLLCCNRTYAQHLCVALISLLDSNKDQSFDIVVVSREEFGSDGDRLLASLAGFRNCSIRFALFEVPAGLRLPVRAHYSVDNYSRLWIADFFPAAVRRVLYLDCDLIVLGEVADLYNVDLNGSLLGAVSIPGSTRCTLLGIPERFGYFNSGVMIIDLEQWRATRAAAEVIDYIVANPDKLIDADQDALNGCFFARRKAVPYVWNVITPFYFDYHPLGMDQTIVDEVRQGARIVHFNGASKPWSYMSRHPHRQDYARYLRRSEWRDYVPPDRTISNMLKKHLATFVPKRVTRAVG